MNKQQIIIGGAVLLVFLPAVLAGIFCYFLYSYFEKGYQFAEELADAIDYQLEK